MNKEQDNDEEVVRSESLFDKISTAEIDSSSEDEDDEAESEEGSYEIKRVPWKLKIDGLDAEIVLTGLKLPMFQSGAAEGGDMMIEYPNMPGHLFNKFMNSWLRVPQSKKITVECYDPGGVPLENWEMTVVPAVMGCSPLNVKDDSPWVTQIIFKASSISITEISVPE